MKNRIDRCCVAALLLLLLGCSEHQDVKKTEENTQEITKTVVAIDTLSIQKRWIDSVLSQKNLVDITELNSDIQVDLKYATADNFMHKVLYKALRTVYVQKDVAQRLDKCQILLDSLRPGYKLLVYDGVRPVDVQQAMWDGLDTIPINDRVKFVSNPKNKSLHNYGVAVDITIKDSLGNVLDMGAGYDDMRKIAYPSMEALFLESGDLTQEQYKNRILLRKVMRSQGFFNIQTEWWHFNACNRVYAASHYEILEKEPVYPNDLW